jgi:O-antigen ligase
VKRFALEALADIAANPVARTIAAFLLFAASLGGLTLTAYADQYVNGGVAWGEGHPPVAHADVNPLGVNVFLEKEVDFSKAERTLQMAEDAGFKWVRQGFAWNDIEISEKGNYTDARNPGQAVDAWAKYDKIVEACERHELEIIARLDSPPVWARIPGDDVATYHKGPPRDYNDYGDFVAAVVSRYKGRIKYFQIWNEPNLLGEWGGHPVNPEEYTALLKVAYERAKGVDPEAVIITAALAPTAENSVANLNDVLYLEGMYRAGAADYFDILSTMVYGLGQSPGDRRTDLKRLNFSRPILLRRVMEQFGDVNTPVWISEYSWVSLPTGWEEDCRKREVGRACGANIWGKSVDEATQARYLVEGYERAQTEWPWMGVMNVWYLREPDPRPDEPANYFAIVRPDFTPRPAYNALKEFSARLPLDRTREKPLWNAWGLPLVYGVFGLAAVGSGALAGASLGRWASVALNRPRGRYGEAAREVARNGAVVVGMALLVGVYYRAESVPLMLAALAGWGVLAFLKPSVGLAAVAFTIPFLWYPKFIGSQKFPLAETLLVLVFGAMVARRAVAVLLPGVAGKLRIEPQRRGDAEVVAGVPNGTVGVGEVAPVTNGAGPRGVKETVPLPTLAQAATERLPGLAQVPATVRLPVKAQVRPVVARVGSKTYRGGSRLAIRHSVNGHSPAVGISIPKLKTQNSKLKTAVERFREWSREDAFAAPAVALLVVGTLSLLTLADQAFARDSARAYRWVIVEPVLLYFLLTDIIRGRRGLLRMLDFFVAAGVGVALLGIWQFVGGTDTLAVEGVSRVSGVYQHPNNLALYLGRVLPFAACMALFLPWGWRKTLYGAASVPLGLAFLLTYSRGAWVALAVAMAVAVVVGLRWRMSQGVGTTRLREMPAWARVWLTGRRRKWTIAGGVVVGLLVVLMAAAVVVPRLPERVFAPGSGILRVKLWDSSLRMLADHPVFGVGIDQFLNQFQAHYITDEQQEGEKFTAHPHNILLDYWLSLGIMGVLVLAWLLWRYFREAVGRVREAASRLGRDPVGRALALGLLASMVDFLAHGMVDNSYFLMDLALIFWLSCGLLQLLRRGA